MAAQASTIAIDPMQVLSAANAIPTTSGYGTLSAGLGIAGAAGNIVASPFQMYNNYQAAKTEASNYAKTAVALISEKRYVLDKFNFETRKLAGQQTIGYIMSGLDIGAGGTPEKVMSETAAARKTDYERISANYDTQIQNAYRAEEATRKQGKRGLIGGIAQLTGTAVAGGLMLFSDKRLKENLIPVGKADNGLTIYIGNYTKESGLDDGKPHLFLIAQEVQKIRPDAVVETESGYLAVDYVKALL